MTCPLSEYSLNGIFVGNITNGSLMAVLICKNPNASSVATLAEPHYLVKITHGLGHCASKYYHLEILSPPNCELFTTAVCALPHLTWHRRVEDDDVIESILRNSFLVNCP